MCFQCCHHLFSAGDDDAGEDTYSSVKDTNDSDLSVRWNVSNQRGQREQQASSIGPSYKARPVASF